MNETPERKIELNGFSLIEASAGTGKTYTIQNLYLRLIAGWCDEPDGPEKHLAADEILVMTYTEAATGELKERIRKILAQGLLLFENPKALDKDEFERVDELLRDSRGLHLPGQTQDDRDRVLRNRIRNALLIFDEAAIFTIHGFCQRLLTQYAFESGILFNTEIRTDEKKLIGDLVMDYLRACIYPESSPLDSLLKKEMLSDFTKNKLQNLTMQLLNRPGLRVTGIPNRTPDELRQDIEKVLNRLQEEYQPGLAGKMQYPKAESADRILGDWKSRGQARDTGEAELEILLELHDFLEKAESKEQFSRFSELCTELFRLREDYQLSIPHHAAFLAMKRFSELKLQENFLTFNDLLKNVLHAVQEKNSQLRNLVRKQYHAAIIDEFQDTDPVQFEIFRQIFGSRETGHILFFVGDPKQAIYSFRGGDSATYRIARDFVTKERDEYLLTKNYRSAGKLLDAINDIFAKWPVDKNTKENVFADPSIKFQPVETGKKGTGLIDESGNEDLLPFKFCWLTALSEKVPATVNLDETKKRSIRVCAEDIVKLLNSAPKNPDTGKALRPNDIAVLVPDNDDAKKMQAELKKRNVPCVIPRSENVFKSAAAKYLQTVLKAVESPSDSNLVSEAMLTPILGFTLDKLIEVHAAAAGSGTENALSVTQEKMRQLSDLWQQSSFLKMFQEMLRTFEIRSKLLLRNDGERILTDLLHLRDLIHQKICETGLSAAGVLSFLAAQENGEDSEEKETMMETDRSAVVISTIHSSKGLEYPVVMLPLMFKRTFSYRSGHDECYHDSAGQLILNMKPDLDAVKFIEKEMKQEQMRLLYVALTRAKYSCYLYWGLISGNNNTGLHDQTALDWLFPTISGHRFENLKVPVPQLERCETRIVYIDLTGFTSWHPEIDLTDSLAFREWHGKIDQNYHFTSFTALAGGHDGSDGMDYDDDDSGSRLEKPVGIFKIPAGAQTGNAWHDIMEEIDFTSFDPARKADRDFIGQKMELFGVLYKGMPETLREEYVKLTGEMIVQLLNTPLLDADGQTFYLRDIPRNERLSELKFNYRFHQGLQAEKLIAALSGYVKDVFSLDKEEMTIRKLNISGGCLNGALDLLFRRNGKFYIADWKSNRITGKASGFDRDGVTGEMADHTYYLQYLIYTVAAVKYLELHLHHSLSEADYDRLFGGVFYFFMRGVDSVCPGQGVFYGRPPYELVRQLEQIIG